MAVLLLSNTRVYLSTSVHTSLARTPYAVQYTCSFTIILYACFLFFRSLRKNQFPYRRCFSAWHHQCRDVLIKENIMYLQCVVFIRNKNAKNVTSASPFWYDVCDFYLFISLLFRSNVSPRNIILVRVSLTVDFRWSSLHQRDAFPFLLTRYLVVTVIARGR